LKAVDRRYNISVCGTHRHAWENVSKLIQSTPRVMACTGYECTVVSFNEHASGLYKVEKSLVQPRDNQLSQDRGGGGHECRSC